MTIDLETALSAPVAPPLGRRPVSVPIPGERPASSIWDGNSGVICTPTISERPKSWDDYLIDAGLDPEVVEVVEPVQVRAWDANIGGGVIQRLRYYRLTVRTRRGGPSIDDLLAIVKRRKVHAPAPTGKGAEAATYSVDLGDLQLGKIDGDGIEGTVMRIVDSLDRAVDQLKSHRRAKVAIGAVKLAWLGDCVEGFVSQGGSNAWRTQLTATEQTRLLRRIMLHAVDLFAPLTDDLVQLAIPGNHDQAVRLGGKGLTRYDDSLDVEALVTVADALKMNTAGVYDHVRTYTPDRDELTVTIETAGTIVTHAHGHQFGGVNKAMDWWKGQALGDTQSGRADVLFSGHFHHLRVEQSGKRTWIQVPALESESTWFRHNKGVTGAPGVMTSILLDGKIGHIHVC